MTRQIVVVTGMIRNERGEILLQRRHDPMVSWAHGRWNFPGGGIDDHETPEQALVRECREELGVEVKVGRMIPFIFSRIAPVSPGYPEAGARLFIICFACTILGGTAHPANEEVSEVFWGAPYELAKKDCLSGTLEFIKAASL